MIVTMAEMFVGTCVKFAVPMLISENTPVVHCIACAQLDSNATLLQ